ncbi:hypothetical protein KIPB_015359, partial [Kipferlia bialata]|eukprot:g15359.t1
MGDVSLEAFLQSTPNVVEV